MVCRSLPFHAGNSFTLKKKSKQNKSQPKNVNKPKKAVATTMTKKNGVSGNNSFSGTPVPPP